MESPLIGASKPRLLVLSQVLPFPGNSGQQQRVYYSLKALRNHFHVTFVTTAKRGSIPEVRAQLLNHCDEAVLLPSRYARGGLVKAWHRAVGMLYVLRTGLKFSNYVIGQVEFAPDRLAAILEDRTFDCALFEYWHAHSSASLFQREGIPCVLDMHNILWQSLARQLIARPYLPRWWKRRRLTHYRRREEQAWTRFDALIAINKAERNYTRAQVPEHRSVFYAPMGTDLTVWPHAWQPALPPRIGYYGGLGSPHNQQDALQCYEHIMPAIWRVHPRAELWLVGSSPPPSLRLLAERDERVTVTGYVERVQDILKTMSVVVCPWTGTYGFRSRLVEVMALGIPVVAAPDAVDGMEMEAGQGIFLEETASRMTQVCLRLLAEPAFARQQSEAARAQVETKFSFEATYGRLAQDLRAFAAQKGTLERLNIP